MLLRVLVDFAATRRLVLFLAVLLLAFVDFLAPERVLVDFGAILVLLEPLDLAAVRTRPRVVFVALRVAISVAPLKTWWGTCCRGMLHAGTQKGEATASTLCIELPKSRARSLARNAPSIAVDL